MSLPVRQLKSSAALKVQPVLVVAEPLLPTLLRLCIWVTVVAGFYAVTIPAVAPTVGVWHSADVKNGLLLLFPLFLLPYLIGCIRSLMGAGRLTFNGTNRVLLRGKKQLAAFKDIRELRWVAVNGTCEEIRLSAVLNDGRRISLYEGGEVAEISRIADQIADLVGVAVNRSA